SAHSSLILVVVAARPERTRLHVAGAEDVLLGLLARPLALSAAADQPLLARLGPVRSTGRTSACSPGSLGVRLSANLESQSSSFVRIVAAHQTSARRAGRTRHQSAPTSTSASFRESRSGL